MGRKTLSYQPTWGCLKSGKFHTFLKPTLNMGPLQFSWLWHWKYIYSCILLIINIKIRTHVKLDNKLFIWLILHNSYLIKINS